MGFNIEATTGTAEFVPAKKSGLRVKPAEKPKNAAKKSRNAIHPGYVSYVVNTRESAGEHEADGQKIRLSAAENNITMLTSLDTARVLLDVLEETTQTISTIDA